jgi:hypothetical protein
MGSTPTASAKQAPNKHWKSGNGTVNATQIFFPHSSHSSGVFRLGRIANRVGVGHFDLDAAGQPFGFVCARRQV